MTDGDIAIAYEKYEKGEFNDLSETESDDDHLIYPVEMLHNEIYGPSECEAMAIRAVLYELNAFIEGELQQLAVFPHAERQEEKGKPPFERLVWDLRFGECIRLVEEYYGVRLSQLPGYSEINHMREMVNAFKHRRGQKDPRPDLLKLWQLEFYEPDRDYAYRMIETVRTFLYALSRATKSTTS